MYHPLPSASASATATATATATTATPTPRTNPYPGGFTEYQSVRWHARIAQRSRAYHAYRRAWEDYPAARHVASMPLCLDLETTNFCNLKCTMCWRTSAIADGTFDALQHMPWDLYTSLIDQCEGDVPSLKLNYYGEPLMDLRLMDRIVYAKRHGLLDVQLNTNATLLTHDRAQRLLDTGIDGVFFSVDGHTAETFNAIRVGASFEKVLDNIEGFVTLRDQGHYNTVTRVNFVCTPENESEWPGYLAFWHERVDAVGMAPVKPSWGGDGHERTIVPDWSCAMPWQRMIISPTGVVTPCCEDNLRQYVLGDAHHTTLHDMWHGAKLTALREAHARCAYHEIALCRGCALPHMG